MIKSEPILPIRFYDNLFDQQRFNFHCSDRCQLDLKFPASAMPHFQFKRNRKYNMPDKFILRSICTDIENNFYKIVPESAANFGRPDTDNFFGAFPKDGSFIPSIGIGTIVDFPFFDINCDYLTSLPFEDPSYITYQPKISVPVLANKYVHFKLIVDEMTISLGSAFEIKIYAGTTYISSIYQPGVYNFDIQTGIATDISVYFVSMNSTDSFKISYIQATYDILSITDPTDIDLNETKLKAIPMNSGEDIIAYCEDISVYNIPQGEYYYIVGNDTNYYVSETFHIISLKESEKLYKLSWNSTCDINDAILYKYASVSCNFINRLFLDAGLFKPEYESKEEGEENGKGDFSAQLQKWKKYLNFEVGKSPEFLSDALSAVFLHDYIRLKKPLNILQETNNGEFAVERVIGDVTNVLEDCFQKVNLKLLLSDAYTDTSCCNTAKLFDCTPCKYTAGDNNCEGYSYYLLMPPEVGVPGLYSCATNAQIYVRPDELICFNGKYVTIGQNEVGVWSITNTYPTIASVTPVWFFYVVTAYIIPNSFAIVEYNKDGAGWTYLDTLTDDGTGLIVYYLPFLIPLGAEDLKIRIHNVTLTCDFGYTDVYDVI